MFEIRATNLRWLETLREAKDHCLHGDVQVRIGDEIFSYENATVSASALLPEPKPTPAAIPSGRL